MPFVLKHTTGNNNNTLTVMLKVKEIMLIPLGLCNERKEWPVVKNVHQLWIVSELCVGLLRWASFSNYWNSNFGWILQLFVAYTLSILFSVKWYIRNQSEWVRIIPLAWELVSQVNSRAGGSHLRCFSKHNVV